MSEPIVRKHYSFSGRVQGVGFRYRARHAAKAVGATGWVRNERDGTVTMELQGTQAQLDRVLWTLYESRYIHVDGLDVRAVPLEPDERSFGEQEDLYW